MADSGGPIIQTANLDQIFQSLKNQDPSKMRNLNVPRTPDYKSIPNQNYAPSMSVHGAFNRFASATSNSGMIYGQPQFFSPVHTPINWQIPSRRIEQYQWARFFYSNEPKVAAAIDFYSFFPMNNFENECRDRDVKKYFDRLVKRIDLAKWTRLISHEVHLLGDCFPFVEVSCEHCFPADTMILTQNGHKKIQDIKVDDLVLTIDGIYESVIKTMSFKYEGQMVELVIQSIPSLKSTSDHKHYIIRPEYRDDNRVKSANWLSPIEVEAKDIKVGDYIACPFNNILRQNIKSIHFDGSQYRFKNKNLGRQIDINIDEDFARLIGWYVAEGSTDSNRKFAFSLSIDEQNYAAQIKEWMEKYFKQGSDIELRWIGNVTQVSGYSREMSAWFDEHCGHGAKNKKIPYFIMGTSKKNKQAFLDAYLLGDGCPRKSRNENTLSTISKTLCYDIIALLADLGYSCYVDEKEECVDNLGIHRCHSYRINYRIETKRDNGQGQGTHKENNMIFFKVKDVVTTKEKTTVYNFTVNKYHNYVSNFCYTKNCNGNGKNGDELCEHEGGTIRRVVILNPDYVEVYTSPINPDPVIALKPDEELINMVQKKTPGFDRLNPEVRTLVSAGRPIRLDNRNVHHIKYGEGGYDRYGIGMVRRLFPILSYKTKLMVAQWIVAERLIIPIKIVKVGSDERPAGPADIAAVQEQLAQTANDPNLTIVTHHAFELDFYGACHDEQTEILTKRGWKKFRDATIEDEIGTYNLTTSELEYQKPIEKQEYNYSGKMFNFNGKHVDICVTPNHMMLVSKMKYKNEKPDGYNEWKKIRADEVSHNDRFINQITWSGKIPDILPYKDTMLGHLDLDTYLEFVGYYLSEGGIKISDGSPDAIHLTQKVNSEYYNRMKQLMALVKDNVKISQVIGTLSRDDIPIAQIIINSRKLAKEMMSIYGHKSYRKFVPRWILDLPCEKLKILFDAMMNGDGSRRLSKLGRLRMRYNTVSKQLSEDVYEIGMKLGYSVLIKKEHRQPYKNYNVHDIYRIYFSLGHEEKYRTIRKKHIRQIDYKGKVYCFTVPNGYIITRRNGRIGIHGNSGKVLTLSNEFELINQEILDGMMINNALLNGEGPNFSAAAVGIEAMIERLQTFRREMSDWIEQKIYLPEAKRQGFIDENAESEEDEYIYPKIKWNSMHLRDQQQFRTFVLQLHEKGLLSAQTVLEAFDFDPDQEIERKRYDAIQMAALGQGMGGGPGGDMGGGFGGMGGGGGGGGMPPMPGMGGDAGMGGDMGGAPGGMGGGAPISAPPAGAPPMASAKNSITALSQSNMPSLPNNMANPANYGGRVLKQKTREKMDSEKQKVYKQLQHQKEKQPGMTGVRDAKGRIIFTKCERQLMDQLQAYAKNGLIRYPIVPQFEVKFGSITYPIDFAFPHLKIAIEADGEAFHSSPKQIVHDKERDMKLAQVGWTVLRFKDEDIEDRAERVMSTIIKTIMQKESLLEKQKELVK